MSIKIKIPHIISFMLIISISLFIILLNARLIIFNETLYKNEFAKHEVYNQLKDVNIGQINKEVLEYLKGNSRLKTEFFSQREKLHLNDVKALIQKGNKIFLSLIPIIFILSISLFLSLNKKLFVKYFSTILIISGLIILVTNLLLILIVNLNFQGSFDIFHKLSFKQNTWLFAPEFEKIVVLYPPELFFDIAQRILISSIIISLILLGVGLILNKKVFK